MAHKAKAIKLSDLSDADRTEIEGLIMGNAIRNVLIRIIEEKIQNISDTQEFNLNLELGTPISDAIINLADVILQNTKKSPE